MTLDLVRSLLTATLFAAFILLWIWAWSKPREKDFDEAAALPLSDEISSANPGDQP